MRRLIPVVLTSSAIADNAGFAAAKTTTTWQIQNVQMKCDLVTLHGGLNESYSKLLEEGKKHTLNYNTFISQYQTFYYQMTSLLS